MSAQALERRIEHGHSNGKKPTIQVICLGSGGGPSEDNVSGFLVRSSSAEWRRGSILAVDAGSHLAAITRILERHLPAVSRDRSRMDSQGNVYSQPAQSPHHFVDDTSSPPTSPNLPKLDPIVLDNGPFAGVPLPHASARANAAHIVRSHVATYLISHPHLDHISGFAINTAAFHATSRPKTLAALPFTVEAIKRHIFNDVIWPNLTDEDGGVGFVTFQRLKEGGDVMVGEGEGRGYIEVCEGLGTIGFKISHGKCMRPGATQSHRGSISNLSDAGNGYSTTPKYSEGRNHSFSHLHLPGTPGSFQSPIMPATSHPFQQDPNAMAVDSTAYFIRDIASCREVLMFGDVEPDSISIAPRLARVWAEAAPKIASGALTGIFIECSYPDSQLDAVLFGHLAPRHLIIELQTLADMVREERANRANERLLRKRKRGLNGSVNMSGGDDLLEQKRSRSLAGRTANYSYRRSSVPENALENSPTSMPYAASPMSRPEVGGDTPKPKSMSMASISSNESTPAAAASSSVPVTSQDPPLEGLRVIVMHIKDTMQDGPHVGELILQQLNEHAAGLAQKGNRLGCDFEVAESGKDYWF